MPNGVSPNHVMENLDKLINDVEVDESDLKPKSA